MYKTEANLQTAFAGESQANRRYLFFADRAEKEGYPQVARLFRAAAEAETVHARNHFNAMNGVGATKENLMAASMGEHYEFTRMYPPFIAAAEEENNQRAHTSFEYANEVEQIHHRLFEEVLKAVNGGRPLKNEPYFVCPVCGNTVAGAAPEKCPICGTARDKFKRVD
ncbi:MAG: rubrerythrin family protein [Dehalococcoidales bacterium]|nr:rubrerythrin family protein [Dehalococcoidales bacterium]